MARVARQVNGEAAKEKTVINGGGRKRKAGEAAGVASETKTSADAQKESTIKVITQVETSTSTQTTTIKPKTKPMRTSGATSTITLHPKPKAAKASKIDSSSAPDTKSTTKAPQASKKTRRKADSPALKEPTPVDTDSDASGEEEAPRPSKKAKGNDGTAGQPKAYVAPLPKNKKAKVVKERSGKRFNVYVFGKGDMCELGLGPKERKVTRPRLNPFLPIDTVGAVQVAVGGMHTAVLAHDGAILTWGVNDQNALGRNTDWAAPEVDIDDAASDDSEDADINPKESIPGPVEGLPKEVDIVNIACSDSLTCAITSTGFVYAWGTFRCSDGLLGFSETQDIAHHPVLLPNLKNIVEIVTGTDHVLARSSTGSIYAWGNGQQYQLGRRVIERTRLNGLTPRELKFKKIRSIGAGSYHSFAIDVKGQVWAWGLNQYGQCGVNINDSLGEDGAAVPKPTLVQGLSKYEVVQITGGEHHSAAVTADGKLLVWGRLDANQLGLAQDAYPKESTVFDEHGKPRFVSEPTEVPNLPPIASVACGTHHNIAITKDGQAFSWGFGENYQVGQGPKGEDVLLPTHIDNSAVRDIQLEFAGCGGQFSVVAGVSKDAEASMANGAS